jgi:long-chain acyl-CoA synthetase
MSLITARGTAANPTGIALVDPGRELTWAEVDEALNRLTNALLEEDLGVERRVVVCAENCVEAVLCHLAAIQAGASSVPAAIHLTSRELQHIIGNSAAAIVFTGAGTAGRVSTAAKACGVTKVVAWGVDPAGDDTNAVAFDLYLGKASPSEPPRDIAPRPHLHYTSGTTGVPKGTDTPPALFAGGRDIADHVARSASSPLFAVGGTAMVVGPLSHTGPLGTIRALFAGLGLVLPGRFDPETVLHFIDHYKVTLTLMVPTHFVRLLQLPPDVRSRFDVSSLRLVAHTGAPCPEPIKRAMIDWFGPVILEAYGGTELGTTNMISAPEWLDRPGSVGRAVPPFEIIIVDDQQQRLGPGEVGTIYIRDGSGRGISYRNDPEKTASVTLEPGVATLGDMGYLDDEGYLYITGRVIDMVLSGGVNVYPAEAENVLIQHGRVADVACLGHPDPDLGEHLRAIVVPADPASPPEPSDLHAFCRERLASYKTPKSFHYIDDLGRDPFGKLNKRTLRRRLWPDLESTQ